jgi:hypothetical protein
MYILCAFPILMLLIHLRKRLPAKQPTNRIRYSQKSSFATKTPLWLFAKMIAKLSCVSVYLQIYTTKTQIILSEYDTCAFKFFPLLLTNPLKSSRLSPDFNRDMGQTTR